MQDIEIYLVWVDYRSEVECPLKGLRSDIYVKIDNNFYNLNAYDPVTFKQNFDRFVGMQGHYYHEANTIFVPEVTREHIINTILHLTKPEAKNFFSDLKPLDPEEVKKLNLTKIYPER